MIYDYLEEMPYADPRCVDRICADIRSKLADISKEYLFPILKYCLGELCENANRANAKRVYAALKGLPDGSLPPEELSTFKEYYQTHVEDLRQIMTDAGCKIRIDVEIDTEENQIYMRVINNTPIGPVEREKIQKRLVEAYEYRDIKDAYAAVGSSTESMGLGIISMIIGLRKFGGARDCIQYSVDEKGNTNAKVKLPLEAITENLLNMLSLDLQKYVGDLPALPDRIRQISAYIEVGQAEAGKIWEMMRTEPDLISDITLTARHKPFEVAASGLDARDALMRLNPDKLRAILLYVAIRRAMGEYDKVGAVIWESNLICADYAVEIARIAGGAPEHDLFLSTAIQDIGKMVILGAHDILQLEMLYQCIEHKIDPGVIKELSAGSAHALLGSKMAEKWNLPESITAAIRYHHDPVKAGKNHVETVYPVYLANVFKNAGSNASALKTVPRSVRQFFHCDSTADLADLCQQVKDIVCRRPPSPLFLTGRGAAGN